MISKRLYTELDLKGLPPEVFLVTADGKQNLISSIDTNFKIGPIDNSNTRFEIDSALVLDQMPSIEKNFPTASNLDCFENAADLIRKNKFPNLVDENLHLIVGIREANLINYDKVRKPSNTDQPFIPYAR